MLYIDENCAEDPTFHLKQLADVQGIASTKVKYMALGANNGKVATDLLDTAFIRGQVKLGTKFTKVISQILRIYSQFSRLITVL